MRTGMRLRTHDKLATVRVVIRRGAFLALVAAIEALNFEIVPGLRRKSSATWRPSWQVTCSYIALRSM